jgi:cytochrome P450
MTTMQRPALSELANPATLPDPYPVLAGLRDASPFAEFDGKFVVAGRHADISAVLRHPNASSERSTRPITPACAAWSPRRSRPA